MRNVNYDSLSTVVAPYIGAWIEMCIILFLSSISTVAPYIGA
ncbi:hypothetical protein P4529_20485 [Virgibacillus pantothenticus]|nr:hypothetical protein [Virgibacillus pantothenticus]